MTEVLPELRALPTGLVLDGELVAWRGSVPHFPLVCRRVINRDMSIPLTSSSSISFELTAKTSRLRRTSNGANGWRHAGRTAKDGRPRNVFDDGRALFTAVCELGFEGVIAKNHSSLYRPGDRGWVKVKNPSYWRRGHELEAVRRSRERARQTAGRL